MDDVRQYMLSVTATALFCGIVNNFIGKKGANASIIKLLTGLFMAVTIVSPLVNVDFTELAVIDDFISDDAERAVYSGQETAQNALRQIIIEKTEAYILDKATSLEMDMKVEVLLNDDTPPVPYCVTISGNASPYAKRVLCSYIESNLGIPKENQIWI